MGLATRNLRLFIAYRALSRAILFAPYLYYFATSVRGLSTLEFGVLQTIYYYVAVSLEIPSGVLADRIGRKVTLVAGALLTALGSGLRFFAFDFATFVAAEVCFAAGLAMTSGSKVAGREPKNRAPTPPLAASHGEAGQEAHARAGLGRHDGNVHRHVQDAG